jgi:CheY-like chemotaxis protein
MTLFGWDNPIKAIAWHRKNITDLIISDIKMPEMRGDEFYILKNNELFKAIPVIMLSTRIAPANASAVVGRSRRLHRQALQSHGIESKA